MSDSKSGSKTNLNESNMPLLSPEAEKLGETPEKELIEMKESEKDDSNTEKDKKKSKDKKPKEKKPKKQPGASCLDTMTQSLDLTNRDYGSINGHINLSFNDVLAEPANAQGFEGVWKLAYLVFTNTRLWFYRLLASLLAIPAAFVWGFIFSLLTFTQVWIVAPVFKIFDLIFATTRRLITGLMAATLEPVCVAMGGVFSKLNAAQQRQMVQEP